MGDNLPARKYNVGERTERYLHFELAHTGSATDSHFLDLAAAMSMVNKRFYRQGLYYYVKSVSVVETTADTKVQLGTAPDTWHIVQSWRNGFRNWNKMNTLAADSIAGGVEGVKGAYSDFKIYLNNNHRGESDVIFPSNGPTSMDGDPHYTADEWDYSSYHTHHPETSTANNADRDTFAIMLLGNHVAGSGGEDAYAAVSLAASYAKTKRLRRSDTPRQFDDVGDDPIARLFDASSSGDNILDDLQDENDSAPYNSDGIYMDTILRAQASVGPTSTKTATMPGFCVPFGLLEVLTTCGGDNTVKVLIEMAPGPYHGVYAERLA